MAREITITAKNENGRTQRFDLLTNLTGEVFAVCQMFDTEWGPAKVVSLHPTEAAALEAMPSNPWGHAIGRGVVA